MTDFWQGLLDLAAAAPDLPPPAPREPTEHEQWSDRVRRLAREARDARDALAAPRPTVDRWAVGHAHHGFGYGSSRSGNHAVVLHRLQTGRLVRQPGDALCKPAAKFWTWELIESAGQSDTVDCVRCTEIAGRLGLDLNRPSDPLEAS